MLVASLTAVLAGFSEKFKNNFKILNARIFSFSQGRHIRGAAKLGLDSFLT